MFKLSAKLIAKSLIKEGECKYGRWQLIHFIVQKQHKKEKVKIIFTAIGKVANQVKDIPLKERITIYFTPKCTEYNGKWFTELKASDVDKYVSKKKVWETMNNFSEPLEEKDYKINKDQQLFTDEEF